MAVFIHNAPAVLPIFPFTTLHDFGWIGVDLFLCLSAFLLTRLLVNEHAQNGSFSTRKFYVRRILRIWPLYFLAVVLATAATTHIVNWTPSIFIRFIGLMTFTDNLMAVFYSFNTFVFASHLWTISYEEQFYAIIPWILRWLLKHGSKYKWAVIAGIFATGVCIKAVLIYLNSPYPTLYVLPFTHFVAILGGFMMGLGLFDEPFRKAPHWLLLLLGVAYLALVVALPNQNVPGWHLIVTYPGISMTLIVYAVIHGRDSFYSRMLRNKTLVYLGRISYGLYVFHYFGLNFGLFLAEYFGVSSQGFEFPLMILLAGFIVTLSYAEVSYRFLEKPFLRLKERFTMIPSRPV